MTRIARCELENGHTSVFSVVNDSAGVITYLKDIVAVTMKIYGIFRNTDTLIFYNIILLLK